jgi:AraC-like DNA-binding protein
MDYRERAPPDRLSGLIKACWTLDATGEAGAWIGQQATPDGCIEIIRRLEGRSRWGGDQPAAFAVGLVERMTEFEISGDARFAAIRLWPWAWPLIADVPLADLSGGWIRFDHELIEALPDFERVERDFPAPAGLNAIGRALTGAATVEEMGAAAGMSPRTLQRWFAGNVGMKPRRYLRLLRFQKAFEQVTETGSLADHAADKGFADQSHMARAFREMAGVPPGKARKSARGPFLT